MVLKPLGSNKLMICPPILIACESSEKDGRVCRKGYSVLRGDKGHSTAGGSCFLLCC